MVPSRKREVDSLGDLAFLIAQVGSHAQNSFGKRVDPLGLRLSHVGVLKAIFAAGGLTQRELGDALGMFPSNLVRLIDELETKELVRRGDKRVRPALLYARPYKEGTKRRVRTDCPDASTSRSHLRCTDSTRAPGTDATASQDRSRSGSSARCSPGTPEAGRTPSNKARNSRSRKNAALVLRSPDLSGIPSAKPPGEHAPQLPPTEDR